MLNSKTKLKQLGNRHGGGEKTSADDLEKTWKKLGKNLEVQNATREETDTPLQKLDTLNKIKFLILRRKEPRAKIALAKLEGRRV